MPVGSQFRPWSREPPFGVLPVSILPSSAPSSAPNAAVLFHPGQKLLVAPHLLKKKPNLSCPP
jgi:hypothetical protein